MKRSKAAVVGAAETTQLGVIPMSQVQLHADAALNAIRDAGLTVSDIDGIATAGETPESLAHYLGITPTWIDATGVGGCSFLMHVRHATAAIEAGLCRTVLITHGESGRSGIAAAGFPVPIRGSLLQQFETPYGTTGPATMFTVPVLRYLKKHGLGEDALAEVAVVQREWAAKNPRATFKNPISVDDVMNSRMISYPFRLLMCCLVTDGGGALIVTSADRAKDFSRPVYIVGTGESVETPMVSQMEDFTTSRAFRVSGREAFKSAGITHADVNHLMIYDAFAHLPLYGLEDLGFCKPGEAAAFIRERNTAPGGKLPMNTNGGGLSYMHSGMYGMYALQESVRQVRGIAAAQVPDVNISVAHGVGGMFAASSTIVFSKNAS
ncbi:thiolase [uncultured Bradyrhizobium sp.]|uniref:thiolase C-terminal domain-containing protein n=1 Tax=Bradyrhizobium sp. TaxID=376 RepID=UPI0026384137|nr:thiolase [uncultured Bradyrhizobium sp.]